MITLQALGRLSAHQGQTKEQVLLNALSNGDVTYASLLEDLRIEWNLPKVRGYVIQYIGDLQSMPENFGVGPFTCRANDYARIERLAHMVIHVYQTLEYGSM